MDINIGQYFQEPIYYYGSADVTHSNADKSSPSFSLVFIGLDE
jgi:hypothetical protein